MADASQYIHGTTDDEQRRLAKLNDLTNPAFLEFLSPRDSERVLDVGSGLGILAAEVARRNPGGKVFGVERSPEQLARAPHGVSNLEFVRGDATSLPFADDEFDLVYCRYLLEHVAEPVRVLREMRRVLRPGGRICVQENDIAVVRHDPPTVKFDDLWQKFATLQQRLGGDAYIGRRLFALMAEAGFRNVTLSIAPEVHRHGSPNYAAWLENLIGNIRSGQQELTARGLADGDDIISAVAELQSLIANPRGTAWFYWNRATASK